MRTSAFFLAVAASSAAVAKLITVTVSTEFAANGTVFDASKVFKPAQIKAKLGDQIVFKFTEGNHSVTRSSFDQPCVPISSTNTTVNGFNSGLRPALNGGVPADFLVDIDSTVVNDTLWFYDINTCGEGGIGVVNVNNSGPQPYNAYVRNAKRLFGPHAHDTTSSSSTDGDSPTSTDSGDGAGSTDTSGDGVMRVASISAFAVLAAGFALVL